MRPLPVITALAAALAVPAAAQRSAPFTVAETGRGFQHLQDAVSAIGGGAGTVTIAPGVYRECASQEAGRITYRAQQPGTVIFEGVACEEKGALVLGGRSATVDGIVFRGLRVNDGNGAGIRWQGGDLSVVNAMFLDSQEGILGMPEGPVRIAIDRSTFAGLGQCDETSDCAHSIYLGSEGPVTVTNSRFERGRGGHYVKVRSPVVQIADNSFDDTAGRTTNYMIDLPEGATGQIARNTFVQGRDKENWSGMIVVAAEKRRFRSGGLRVEDNDARLAPGQTHSPAFVANGSGEQLVIEGNRLGAGIKPYEVRSR